MLTEQVKMKKKYNDKIKKSVQTSSACDTTGSFEQNYMKTCFLLLFFAYAKTKTQISCSFVFATKLVQYLYFQDPKVQTSRYLLWLYTPVCVGPGWKLRKQGFY